MIDANLYVGEYPFRRLPATGGEAVRALLDEIGAERAIATSFHSIFYKDNLDGLRKSLDETASVGDRIFFWAVINPTFPGWEEDMEAALGLPGVIGVRLLPMYHHYSPADGSVLRLMALAAEADVPVNVSHRIVDERLHHWLLNVRPIDLAEMRELIERASDTQIVLSHLYVAEMSQLAPAIKEHPSALVDVGNAKPQVGWVEQVCDQLGPSRLIVGTGAPLYYHRGVLMGLEEAPIAEEARRAILHDNAAHLLP
jgi:predicted TIM-barrel fold metal-dependent hydrolase